MSRVFKSKNKRSNRRYVRRARLPVSMNSGIARSSSLTNPMVNLHPIDPSKDEKSTGIPRSLIPYGGRIVSPFAPCVKGIFTAIYSFALQTANPGFSDTVVKLNSFLTPFPAGGAEYSYYDEMATLYYKYKILSSAISVETHPVSTAPYTLVVTPQPAATAFADIWVASEYPRAVRATCNKGGNRDIVTCNSFVRSFDIQKVDKYISPTAITADPTDVSYWHITVAPDTAAAVDITCYIKLTAEVVFDYPKTSAS